MRYGSVCSGIEAASVAWAPLNWSPAFFAEIEKFPSAVLAHHYGSNMPGDDYSKNGVPNYGDMTKFQEWPDHAIDLLVGGTPCQSFSVAGLRKGLDDPRGNLMLTYLAIARRYQPKWLVWENVPGVLSSNGGRDFGTFIRGLEECGYHAAWRVLDAQYVRVDGFGRAVPQRRRRVFVVGYLGDWRRAAAVLFERESLSGNSAPSRKAGERPTGTISACPTGGGGLGTDFDLDGGLIAASVAPTLNAHFGDKQGLEDQHVNGGCGLFIGHVVGALTAKGPEAMGAPEVDANHYIPVRFDVAHSLRAEGFDASEDGTGRGTPIVPVPYTLAIRGRDGSPDLEYRQDGTANAILTPNGGRAGMGVGAIAFNPKAGGNSTIGKSYLTDGSSYTLDTDCTSVAVAWSIMPQNSGKDYKARQVDVAQPIMAGGPVGGNQGGDYIQQQWAVRRLTPMECERLQGFPDGYTLIPVRKAMAADGPRYKALGNSMAINCMRWIGQRIAKVEAMSDKEMAA